MTGKLPEETRGSGQPRVLRAVTAQTVVVLLGVAEGHRKKECPSRLQKSPLSQGGPQRIQSGSTSYQNTQARPQQSQGASQAFTSPQPYQHQYRPQGFTQNFQTHQASGSQGGHGFGSSGPGSSSSRPGQGRGNKGKGKMTGQAYAFTGADDTQDRTGFS
ncbi:hypothetical protein PanWU01x14_298680 [Parasponia andersonii]|uniref:Uncharacterized protein n=1 Tax=Parasponia andersonii TaxID=3476 RepID=A0A2P5AUJ7_PARAD|nr:hypothetical protein PanWU01x14_298680 [Parasponia andersonii]